MEEKYRIEKWKEVYAPNPAMLRLLMERDGYRVRQWSISPQMTLAKQKHTADRSHWVVSGALELMIDNVGSFVLEAGDRDFLAAETRYAARVVSDVPVLYLVGEKTATAKPKRKRAKK